MENSHNNITDPQLKETLDAIKSITPKHCDNCGNKYDGHNFKLVKNEINHKIIHIHCDSCGNAYLLNIVQPANGMYGSTRSQVNLDVSDVKEMMKFASEGAITADDALDAYNIFTGKSDFFNALFKQQPAGKVQGIPANTQIKQ